MKSETHDMSELIPAEGEFSLEGQFSFDQIRKSLVGDLLAAEFELSSTLGKSQISMLSKKNYTTVWETYEYKQGLICSTRLDQPFAGLFFQLEGSTRGIHTTLELDMNIYPGESNLMIIPPLNESFELKESLSGITFGILLAHDYLLDLTTRFPHQLEPVVEKLKAKDLCQFRDKNLRITPRMRETIQRIQQLDTSQIACSLFLEAQVLDLLALLITQMDQPVKSNGHSFSPSDLDHIYAAREILLSRIANPPTLAELSKLVGSNEYLLKCGFKEIFGSSPYAYLLQHKLEQAKCYILDTQLTLAEIAYKVGYSDPAHFTKAFRKQYGVPPSELR